MANVIDEIARELGLTTLGLAAAASVPPSTLDLARYYRTAFPPKLLAFLERRGIDVAAARERYELRRAALEPASRNKRPRRKPLLKARKQGGQ